MTSDGSSFKASGDWYWMISNKAIKALVHMSGEGTLLSLISSNTLRKPMPTT